MRIKILSLLLLTLGLPIGLIMGLMLPPSVFNTSLGLYLLLAVIGVLVPASGGFLAGWRWGRWGVLPAPLYIVSAVLTVRISIEIQHPDPLPDTNAFLVVLIPGLLGTVVAFVAACLGAGIPWLSSLMRKRSKPQT